jgi:hypothetical protein
MKHVTMSATLLLGWIFVAGCAATYAQHEQHSAAPAASTAATINPADMEHIFCPTMKTGQICSHGTAASLGLQGPDADAWVPIARKYNGAVNAATLQLFKDAETVLSPEQVAQLKAWFAVGLNPQINELLYTKGLGRKTAAAAAKEAK